MLKAIIIGQGMAGSVLAWELHRRGQTIAIIDDCHRTSSTRVAAGMVNPVQGQRLNLAWRIEDCLPAAKAFHQQIAETFGRSFFNETPILRVIDGEAEKNQLAKRRDDPRFTPFLGPDQPADSQHGVNDGDGSLLIHQSGYVETNPLLNCLTEFFQKENLLHQADFDHDHLQVHADHVAWRDLKAERVIFAEGWRILNNPWFKDYNFQPNKGEILTIKSDQPLPANPINRNKWIIPLPDGSAWTGSTYGRGKTDHEPTEAGRFEILSKVEDTLPGHQLRVIGHRAGVRCATGDHIPRAGLHPDNPQVAVFNGFGSKGNVFIPWLARQFADFLIDGKPLPEECDFAARPPKKKPAK
ncbi:MAG: FAD-binding oxidoreductase [Verrucomicrobiota bacterium]